MGSPLSSCLSAATRALTHTDQMVTNALNDAGLESANLIIGIDFTKSNEWTGKHSFNGMSLHAICPVTPNPYQHAISIIGTALLGYDDDKKIPCFGFGDATTHDRKVFRFYHDGRPCDGIEGVLERYEELLPHITLSGPTSFAPLIYAAIEIVKQSLNQYHILVIIADGQVTGNTGSHRGILSQQEKETIDAIVAASNYSLSIIMVGVGDGPWHMMRQFDDAIPRRKFDNFQFVNYTQIMAKYRDPVRRETAFALETLMELPRQYTAIKHMQGVRYSTSKANNSFVLSHPFLRIILLLRSKTLSKEIIQGLPGLRESSAAHFLGNISYEFCSASMFRRLSISCSLDHGSESEGEFRKHNDDTHKEPKRNMAVSPRSAVSITKTFAIFGIKLFFSIVVMLSLAIAGAPAVLSSRLGRRTVVGLINKAIPGHADVQFLSLGWSKPICIEGVSLKGIDGRTVLSILKLETQASLWSLVHGKSGLGDCSIVCPKIDLQEDTKSGLLKVALALIPASKLSLSASQATASPQLAPRRTFPSVEIALAATVKALGGGLKVIDGKLTMREDVAATLGQRVFIDVLLGPWALENDDNLRQAHERHLGSVPLKAGMWSEGTQAEATGFIHMRKQLIDLIQPIKVEMDLSPAVAQLYLARINPLLGEVVGPAVQDEDMPDVVLYISPENLMLPAENFKVSLEPMKAVLARGPLAGGILGLLSTGKEDIAKGRKEVSVQTSRIESQVNIDGSVECSRIDFLIAGKAAMATWGAMNWKDETLKMVIAVSSTTIGNLFGLKISEGYYLKIPVGGTLERPQVDWKAAAIGVAQFSLKQRGGKFFKDFISLFDSEEAVPDPIDATSLTPKS